MADSKTASVQVTPYFLSGERYPSLIGVKVDGDEHEIAYVKKSDMAIAVEYWQRAYREAINDRE